MKQKFFGVNYPHTYQLHDNTFFVGMEVQSADKKKPEEFVMMFSKEQMEDIIFYYNQSVNRLTSTQE